MDIVTYALCKKFALKVSAGYSSVAVDEPNSAIIFTLNDGQKATLHIPRLNEVKNIRLDEINDEVHVIFEMSNGTSIDAGAMPQQKVLISKKEGNALKELSDGYYVSKSAVEIDPSADNAITDTGNGLYVKKDYYTSKEVDDKFVAQDDIEDIISDEIEPIKDSSIIDIFS